MADSTQQAEAVGGVASASTPGAIINPPTDGATGNVSDARVYQAGGWLPSDVASVVRVLERMYAHMLATTLIRRGYIDQVVTLQALVELETVLDARPYGYTQVAISATTAANVELVREGVALALALTPGRFATIQQPTGTKIRLKANDPTIAVTFRYSDITFGSVLP